MKLKRFCQYISRELPLGFIGILTNWMPDGPISCCLRGWLSKPFFKKCGKNFQYGTHVHFVWPHAIEIGDNVYLAAGCWIIGGAGVTIEEEVIFGPYAIIAAGTHKFKHGSARFGGAKRSPVKIGRGSWVAAHAVITPGVTIGAGNLIAANAVVTKDTPDNVVAGGVPAKVIKARQDDD